MDEPKGLASFCCQNSDCSRYGQRGGGNLSVCATYGKHDQRLLYCHACKARFSELKGTAFFHSKLPHEKVLEVLKLLGEGLGVRQCSRLAGVHRDTVTRLARVAGRHAKALHDEVVAFSPRDRRGATRREVVVRGKEAEKLRPRRPP